MPKRRPKPPKTGTPLAPPVAKPANPNGRPSAYTTAIADTIINRLSEGESLRTVCASDDALPHRLTVLEWVASNREGFRDRYARARQAGADAEFEEIVAIADNQDEDPNSRRVRMEARKWVLAKKHPERYGDRLDLNVSTDANAMDDQTFNATLDARMRPKLEALFARTPAPTVDQIIGAFQVPALPKPKGG